MINIQSKNGNSKFFLLTLLGMLTAFGPFVTDMYLPSLPSMGEYFKTTPSLVQLGLTASMIGLAAGQIFFGPLSDKYGRRSPLLAAMYLFIISTIGCIFAPTIEIFAILRLACISPPLTQSAPKSYSAIIDKMRGLAFALTA